MANRNLTVYYVGMTSDLMFRVQEHKNGRSHFTSKYNCTLLLYYEDYVHVNLAIARDKKLKKWKRAWKDELIIKENADMKDLAADWYG